MEHAKFIAEKYSKDRSTKVGCLIVGQDYSPLSWGYNGFPRGANDELECRHARPVKYLWSEHSERNAMYNAARNGVKLLGSRLYVTSLIPCPDCARGIIQSGVDSIYLEKAAFDTSNPRAVAWLENWPTTLEMLKECKIKIHVQGLS
jgi:dCMP deaminase